ncbi:MAG: nuclear transport factor 2 family protein [Dehalococcoidia bacterium]
MSADATRAIVEDYARAWTGGDVATARALLADDLDFEGPVDTFHHADQLIEALRGLVSMTQRVDRLAAFYGDTEAMLLYDVVTGTPAGTIRTAEHFTIENGRIARIRLVFDATILRTLMSSA